MFTQNDLDINSNPFIKKSRINEPLKIKSGKLCIIVKIYSNQLVMAQKTIFNRSTIDIP